MLCVCMFWVATRLLTGCMRANPCVRATRVDLMRLGVWLCVRLLCLLRGCIALEFGLVSLGLHAVGQAKRFRTIPRSFYECLRRCGQHCTSVPATRQTLCTRRL